MESPSPDETILNNTCVELLRKLTLAVEQNTSQIDQFTNTVSSVISNFPTPSNSPEELCTEEYEINTECTCSSDIDEEIPDLLTKLDGCNSNKSSVILPSTTRERVLFDNPEKDTTEEHEINTECTCSSDIDEKIPDLLTKLDGCNSNKSSVTLPSTTRERVLFDNPEKDITEEHEINTECIGSSDIHEKIQDLLTKLDGCDSNKSSVILPSTTRKRLLFDNPERDTTNPSDLKKLCIRPMNELPQVKPTSNVIALHNEVSDPSLSVNEIEKDDYILPQNLKYIDKHLNYLVNNIYKSIPKGSSKTSPSSFNRASKHILAFKSLVIDHGRHLADNNHWPIIMDYVFMAWKHVSSTPKWDNPTHNAARRQCFKSLLGLCVLSLEKMKENIKTQDQETFIKMLELINNISGRVKKCLQHLDFDFTIQ